MASGRARDLLVEVGTEPLPARFVEPAREQLRSRIEEALQGQRLAYRSARSFGTLRRLAVLVEGVVEKSSPLSREVQGPPARLFKDEQGRYTPQAEGFARKHGLTPEELQRVSTAKGDFLAARLEAPGEPAEAILQRILPEVISSLEFPKSMEWEPTRLRFGRPLRSLTALYGRKALAFTLAGVRSGRLIGGLPALGKKPAALAEASAYAARLKELLVLVDCVQRREVLERRLEGAAKAAGGRLDLDEELLRETVAMTEHPVPVAGAFRPEFLELPAPLLKLVLKKQLKFFPVLEGDRLRPAFIGVRDGVSEGQALVREGFERVLEARLNDAAFFYARDRRIRLEDRLPGLERVTYQKGLGSLAQKADRVARLAAGLGEAIRSERPVNEPAAAEIARLCYADLLCEVVKEFPELQGTMGGVYARLEGRDERIALGLEQFYFPIAANSPVPFTQEGALASLAGKLDTLCGSFALGLCPTGSADPLALRRQALGVLRILLEKQLPLDLLEALAQGLSLQPLELAAERRAEVQTQLADFLWGRAQSFFEDMGFRADEVRSVRAQGLSHLPRTLMRLSAVRAVRRHPDFEPLAMAFKRAANILRQARVSFAQSPLPQREGLREEAEISLHDALACLEGQVQERLANGGYETGLRAMVSIKPLLDRFFDKVMVMAEDPSLRQARVSLLARLVRLFHSVADLSELQG